MEGKIRVTKQMEFTIIKLHQEGLGYVKIGQALGLKRDQVRYVCKKYETSTDKRAYIEILSFDKLINDAEKRNKILFEKLGI